MWFDIMVARVGHALLKVRSVGFEIYIIFDILLYQTFVCVQCIRFEWVLSEQKARVRISPGMQMACPYVWFSCQSSQNCKGVWVVSIFAFFEKAAFAKESSLLWWTAAAR